MAEVLINKDRKGKDIQRHIQNRKGHMKLEAEIGVMHL